MEVVLHVNRCLPSSCNLSVSFQSSFQHQAFDVLERLDPDPEFWEGTRAGKVGWKCGETVGSWMASSGTLAAEFGNAYILYSGMATF